MSIFPVPFSRAKCRSVVLSEYRLALCICGDQFLDPLCWILNPGIFGSVGESSEEVALYFTEPCFVEAALYFVPVTQNGSERRSHLYGAFRPLQN